MACDSVAPPGGYLTTGQAAQRIGGTPQHVRRLIADGLLPAINIGRGPVRPRFRVAEAAVLDYLRAHAVRPDPSEVA